MTKQQEICYDVFNGDADGICALHQLRLAEPRDARLISGVKRDIRLLSKIIDAENADIMVFDVSLDTNRKELTGLLERGCKVTYIDHHYAGDLPANNNLEAHIDPDPETCTSLIVDRMLGGKYRAWAVVAAFGDNLHAAAKKTALTLKLSEEDVLRLRETGELLNYNGYGTTVADLHFAPDLMYEAVKPFENPLDFYQRSTVLEQLRRGYDDDMKRAMECKPLQQNETGRIYRFPTDAWARRVAGVYINQRAREKNDLAHALIVDNGDETFMVSVRAPLNRKEGADTLCRKFPTGGGRAAAAGINALPENRLDDFLNVFNTTFSK